MSAIQELCDQGFATIAGIDPAQRDQLFGTFAGLVDNHRDNLVPTTLDNTGRGYNRGGYREVPAEEKEGQAFAVDKRNFIYDPSYRELWAEAGLIPEVNSFIDACATAYDEATMTLRGIVLGLDELQPGFAERVIGPDGGMSSRLVIMRYRSPTASEDGRLFGSHRDMSVLSAHLGDTAPGFYFTDTSRVPEYHDLDASGVVFAGKQWDAMYPDSPLKARFHGVQLLGSTSIQRMSAVMFVDELGFSRNR